MKLSIELSENQLQKLREEAGRLGILPEQLASAVISDLLATQDNDLRAAVDHVLRKKKNSTAT